MQAKRPVPLKQTETQGNNKRFGFPLHLVAARNVVESPLVAGIHTQTSNLNTGTQLEIPVGAFKTVAIVIAYGRTSQLDRKSTRLNSSHVRISYAVFCL